MVQRLKSWGHAARHELALAGVCMLMVVLAYHVVFGVNGLLGYQQKRRESRDLQQQIETLQRQNAQIQQEIKALKSDPQTIEKEARERLHYARPGEVVYTLPAGRPATTSAAQK